MRHEHDYVEEWEKYEAYERLAKSYDDLMDAALSMVEDGEDGKVPHWQTRQTVLRIYRERPYGI